MSYTAEPKQQDTNIKVPLISKIAYGMGDVGQHPVTAVLGKRCSLFHGRRPE